MHPLQFPMRARSAIGLLFLATGLVACDAGHGRPSSDNLHRGPSLSIVQPGSEAVIARPAPSGSGYRLPQVLFELAHSATAKERQAIRILWSLDGGPPQQHDDPSGPLTLSTEPVPPGTHVLLACAVNADSGLPYPNPEAMAVRLFHVVAEGGERDLWRPAATADLPRMPFRESDPWLFVVGPRGTLRSSAESPAALTFVFRGGVLGSTSWRVAYRIDGGPWQAAYASAPASLGPLASGDHEVLVRLEQWIPAASEDATGSWQPRWRPVFARQAGAEDPVAGELNFVKLAFTLQP